MRNARRQEALVFTITVTLALLFLLTPLAARWVQGNASLLGEGSYFHLGLAQGLLSGSGASGATLFDAVVAGLCSFLDPIVAGKALPLLMGILSMVVFFFHARRVLDDEERAAASLLLLISPLFLVTFTSLGPAAMVLFIMLCSWSLYERRPILSVSLLGLLVFVDAKGFIISSLLLIAYGLLRGKWKPAAMASGAGLILIVLLQEIFGFLAHEMVLMPSSISDFFVSLGADFGYSFFILFLALVGVLAVWSKKRSEVAASVILLGLFLFSFGDTTARVLLLPVMALFAGKGVLVLVRRSWSVRAIRNATLFLGALSLLFTLVMTVSSLVDAQPSTQKLEALRFLRTLPDDQVVLSSAHNGIFIERIAGQPAFLDDVVGAESSGWQREAVAQRIFMAQRASTAADLLTSQGISHILIDQSMHDGDVWTYEEQGLLFLLEHSPRFVKLYDKGGVQVYRFNGQ